MVNASGNQVEGPYTYDSYGNCFSGGVACGPSGTPYRFVGMRLDPETGLYFDRARYYSSALGRFYQVDPIGYTADLNLYTYGGNDPTDHTDPTGLVHDIPVETSQTETTTNSNGSVTVTRTTHVTVQPVVNGSISRSTATGSLTLETQKSFNGAPAVISNVTQNKILNLSEEVEKAINVTSGIRTAAQNAAVRGAPRSAHLDPNSGVADISISGFSLEQTAAAAYHSGQFGRVSQYTDDKHVHVDDRKPAGGAGYYRAVGPKRTWQQIPPPQ
jgi:RHS repeat-associated protein